MDIEIKKLPGKFFGSGETKDFVFTVETESTKGYIYKVEYSDKNISNKQWFEVYKKNIVPICIDFKERIYSENKFKESLPKAKDFGRTAWTTSNIEQAKEILNKL